MTGPTPDPSGNIAPGLYYADGDPPGTVRQWDGTQWVGGPVPAPPTGGTGGASTSYQPDTYATVGIRIGAALIDLVISIAIALAIAIPLVAADAIDSTGDTATGTSFNVGTILASLAFIALQVWLIGQFGGTPGKLILGLRITEADASTTPPSWRHAAMRVVPIAILTSIPVIGPLASLVILVLAIVWVSNDAERRSPFDRVGDTRVVYKNKL